MFAKQRLGLGPMLTQTGLSPRQSSMSSLQTYHSALEGSRRPGGRRHLRAHVRIGAGIGASNRAHQSASVLIRPCAVPENQWALVGRIPTGVAVDGRAVRVGEAVRRVRAAGRERGAVIAGLRPAMVPADAVRLVGRVAGLQVGQGGQHGRDSGGGDVDRRAGRGVDVIPGVMRIMGLVGGQGQALIHFQNFSVLFGVWKIQGGFLRLVSILWR